MFCVSRLFISALQMLILDAVGLQIRRSGKMGAPNDPNTCTCFVKWVHLFSQIHAPVFHTSLIFRSTSGRLQSKNVFPAKIQQTERSNLTFRSIHSIHSFRSFRSFRSIRSISLSLHHDRMAIHDEYDIVHRNQFATFCVQRQNIFPN